MATSTLSRSRLRRLCPAQWHLTQQQWRPPRVARQWFHHHERQRWWGVTTYTLHMHEGTVSHKWWWQPCQQQWWRWWNDGVGKMTQQWWQKDDEHCAWQHDNNNNGVMHTANVRAWGGGGGGNNNVMCMTSVMAEWWQWQCDAHSQCYGSTTVTRGRPVQGWLRLVCGLTVSTTWLQHDWGIIV